MSFSPQMAIPATFMRGGTSKGVFFRLSDLPPACQKPGEARDNLFLRILGSPDPYGKQMDGIGGGGSSTSKGVIVGPASQPDHDIDYLYGQVAIDTAFVDWSGNCGNLTTAAAAFAIHAGFIPSERLPDKGHCTVRIWQANIQKTIIAHVPVQNGQVQEIGDFLLDGVTFPAAEIVLEFLEKSDIGAPALFPTGNEVDILSVPTSIVPAGQIQASLINAGIPTIFINASDLGYTGTELQEDINNDPVALKNFETLRAIGALKMGLITDISDAAHRQHTPKIAMVAPPADYQASSGKIIDRQQVDLLVRALSMGKLHHAMMGTASVAIATAAAIPWTLVHIAAGGTDRPTIRFGHPSGTLQVGAEVTQQAGHWQAVKAVMSRSARILMAGQVFMPADIL